MDAPRGTAPRPSHAQFALKVLLLAVLLASLYLGGDILLQYIKAFLAQQRDGGAWILALLLLTYIVFMAIPFMPGIEVGLIVMLTGGLEGIVTVYVATVSYLVGSLIPGRSLAGFLGWLGLKRAETLVHEIEGMKPSERMAYLTRGAPGRLIPFLLKHRYLAIAALLNMPGNAALGGGGGIGMIAGLSGLFPFLRFLAPVALAVSPIPIVLIVQHLN